MPIANVLAVVPVPVFTAALDWYARLLGQAGSRPMEGDEVGERRRRRPGGGDARDVTTVPGSVRVATLTDPAGNTVTVAQNLSAG